eukprot:9199909-Lingulodinium_polyedra.AAC.1
MSQRAGEIAYVPATALRRALLPFRARSHAGNVNARRHGFDLNKDARGLARLAWVWRGGFVCQNVGLCAVGRRHAWHHCDEAC